MPEGPVDRPDPALIRIRTYEPKDLSAAIEILIAGVGLYPENREEMQPGWGRLIQASIEGDMADVDGYYFAPGGHYWVATYPLAHGSEQLVGMIAIKPHDKDVAELRRLSVHKDYHRCGIGRRLMQTFDDHVQQMKYKRVWLTTGLNATPSHALYEAFGYRNSYTKMLPAGVEVFVYEKRWE